MPYSYSQPSSSNESINSGCCEADGDFGIPRVCFCGAYVKIQTSKNPNTIGRRYYTCPRIYDDDNSHIWKWCDLAVEEEISILKVADRAQLERDRSLMERVTVLHEISTERIQNLTDEFERMKAEIELTRINYLTDELERLKAEIGVTRNDDDKLMVFGLFVILMCVLALVV